MLSVNPISLNNYSVNFQRKGSIRNIFFKKKTVSSIVEKKIDLSKLPEKYKQMYDKFVYAISNPTNSKQEMDFILFFTEKLRKYGA